MPSRLGPVRVSGGGRQLRRSQCGHLTLAVCPEGEERARQRCLLRDDVENLVHRRLHDPLHRSQLPLLAFGDEVFDGDR